MTLREHVRTHTADLLRRLALQIREASSRNDEESVHDLRVSIRRLRECLRTFKELYPAESRKAVRKELRGLMKFAESVRSADIAADLMKKAGLDDTSQHLQQVVEQRVKHHAALRGELEALAKRPYLRMWRKGLGV